MKNSKAQVDIGAWIVSVLTSIWLYIILAVMLLTGVGVRWLRKTRLSKKALWAIVIIGGVIAFLGVGVFGVGTVAGAGDIRISHIQTTTAYTIDNGTAVADSGSDDTRMSIFYLGDMTTDANITSGVFLITRGGIGNKGLPASSCKVRVIKPSSFEIGTTTYRIVDQDAQTERMWAWVYTGDSSLAATHTHPRVENMAAFAEGDADEFVSFKIETDATGFDALADWESKDIRVDMCGYPYVYRLVNNGN